VIDGTKWYKAKDIALYLGYNNSKEPIRHIDKKMKSSLTDLKTLALTDKCLLLHKTFIDPQTIFINHTGLIHLVLRSQKPNSIDFAKYLGLDVHQKFVRKEIEIVHELNIFCKTANIKSCHYFTFTKKSNKYILDYYLPDFDIAIEIDEYNHKDRDPKYEISREKFLKTHLQCEFIRCNPDDPEFSLSYLFGLIQKSIMQK
jgi:hypothetical protein